MQREKKYPGVRFNPDAMRNARAALEATLDTDAQKRKAFVFLSTTFPDEYWRHDTEEEFFADTRRSPHFARYSVNYDMFAFSVSIYDDFSTVTVSAPTRAKIETVFEEVERYVESCRVPEIKREEPKVRPRVFVGHGRSQMWRDLKDHLQDQHGYEVEAYETGARAGHTIRDVLEHMAGQAHFACLVLTAEDKHADATVHARENVIHELGLFQGRLGFARAIALLEEGTAEFSNIHGIQQLRFQAGRIKETFGDVLATLRREFGDG